jgi:DNA repair photolyase
MPIVAMPDRPFGTEAVRATTIAIKVPDVVVEDSYRCSPPLIRPSRLTSKQNGGVGKNLSQGWNLNFAVGCTHGCPFCYVDAIHKRFGAFRYGPAVQQKWGDYLLVPENIEEAIEKTPWHRWKGKEVMMSSTHDPYLPTLAAWARVILERALEAGVRICLQTRSFLVVKDLDLLARHRDQVRLQVSIATMDRALARRIEPRVPPPEARLEVLRRAKAKGLRVGVILAPIFPPTSSRPDFAADLRKIVELLRDIRPEHVYGESLHVRGENIRLVEEALCEGIVIGAGFDRAVQRVFQRELNAVGLRGTWWPA